MTLDSSQLLAFFKSGEKKDDQRGIGIEKECFLYNRITGRRLMYVEIQRVLLDFASLGFDPVYEGNTLIGGKKEGSSLSLEPGGQFELSAKVHTTLHQAFHEVDIFEKDLLRILDSHGFTKRDIGFEPIWGQDDLSWMPKGRYDIMCTYMPKKGKHGLDMMRRTCTLQVNLDYTSEHNMAEMMFVTQALIPLISGLFAASPFYEGRDSGYKSFRSYVWQNTDPDRCGLLPFAFKKNDEKFLMTYKDYLNYLLKVPMYFVYRDGYIDVAGESFEDFFHGKLKKIPYEKATLQDFYDHITVPFPEVRLKKFIEIRCIDASPIAFAAAAFLVGLLYNNESLEKTYNLLKDWTFECVLEDYHRIPHQGLSSQEWEIAHSLYDFAKDGLYARNLGEEIYLEPLFNIVQTRKTYSDRLLDAFKHGKQI